MTLTMQTALAGFDEGNPADADVAHQPVLDHAGRLAVQVAKAALQGARGNSGTILSQILGGFSEAIAEKATITIPEFAEALQLASARAHNAVLCPVEGTILTVIRETAQAGSQLAQTVVILDHFLSELSQQARQALLTTPLLLPTLKHAGVVDSGGLGLVYLLEGMTRYLQGVPVNEAIDHKEAGWQLPLRDMIQEELSDLYDVQFLIQGEQLNIPHIRDTINTMGTAPLVVGDETMVRVHVHVADPGEPLSYGITQGELHDVVIENMALQIRQRQTIPAETPQTATICIVPGAGFADIAAGLGATHILTGGDLMLDNGDALIKAIEQITVPQIVVLPNSPQTLALARQICPSAGKPVTLIETGSMPAVINALVVFDPAQSLDINQRRMLAALQQTQSLEITETDSQSGLNALATLNPDSYELLTVYYGRTVTPAMAQTLIKRIQVTYPNLEIEALSGGQANSAYIFSLE